MKVPIDRVMTEKEIFQLENHRYNKHYPCFDDTEEFDAWRAKEDSLREEQKEIAKSLGSRFQYISVALYKAHGTLENLLSVVGYPIYHTGIIYSDKCSPYARNSNATEVTFGPNGIFEHAYGEVETVDRRFEKSLILGISTRNGCEIADIYDSMRKKYSAGSYDLLSFNCHTFCNELAEKLGCAKIPQKYTRVTKTGEVVRRKWNKEPGLNIHFSWPSWLRLKICELPA